MPRLFAFVVFGLALCLPVTAGALLTDVSSHPQDGPDADVRMTIDHGMISLDIAMNLAFCDAVVNTEREDEWALPDVERPWVEESLVDFYREKLEITVAGERVDLTASEGLELPPPDLSLLPLFPITGTKGVINVGVKLDYAVEGTPRNVALKWPAFPESTIPGLGPVEVNIQLVALGLAAVNTVTVDEPGFTWHAPEGGLEERFLPVPAAPPPPPGRSVPLWALTAVAWAVLCVILFVVRRKAVVPVAVAGVVIVMLAAVFLGDRGLAASAPVEPPTEAEALEIFDPLHRNIYKAFDFTRESDVYDALARSVDGGLLESLYDEVYQSLIMREEGGAVSRVEAVRYLERDVEVTGPHAFEVRARWQVDGAVFHWGHAHHRTNEHAAVYGVARTLDGWRIATTEMTEQRRVESTPGGVK